MRMTSMVRALALSILAADPIAVGAQGSDVVGVPQLSALQVGVTAKISAAAQKSEGTVTRISHDTVWLSKGKNQLALPLGSVDSAWIRERQTEKGLAIGAGIGAVLLGSFVALVVSGLCETDSCASELPRPMFAGGLIGAGIGGAVGAVIGSAVKRWKRVSP